MVGVGSGMFNSPNTAAMMGTVPAEPARHRRRRADDAAEHRRRDLDRVRARGRHRLGSQGRPAEHLLRRHRPPLRRPSSSRSSTTCTRRSGCSRRPRSSAPRVSLHAAARRPAGRRRSARGAAAIRARGRSLSAAAESSYAIGEVAERTGTTPRTIRYYEEIGLLPRLATRASPAPTASTTTPTSSGSPSCSSSSPCSGSPSTSCARSPPPRARAPACAHEWHAGIEDPVRRREVLEQATRPPRPPARADPRSPRRDRQARGRAGRPPPPRPRPPARARASALAELKCPDRGTVGLRPWDFAAILGAMNGRLPRSPRSLLFARLRARGGVTRAAAKKGKVHVCIAKSAARQGRDATSSGARHCHNGQKSLSSTSGQAGRAGPAGAAGAQGATGDAAADPARAAGGSDHRLEGQASPCSSSSAR